MPAQWTGKLIGDIHNAGLSIKEVAAEAGLNAKYVSQVLNSETPPLKAQYRLEDALGRLIMKKETSA